jgi:DNA-binding NtrC family response regulator
MLGVSAVLLDIVMPDQLCVRLSAYMAEDHRNTPLILMSAGSTEFIRKTAKQLEAIGVRVTGTLVKPFWVDGLLEVLSRATSDPEHSDGDDASAWLPDSAPTD